jgi:hypothetical protein
MASIGIEDADGPPEPWASLPGYFETESVDQISDFPLFPLLAPELRLQIWEYALQEPETAHRRWNNAKFGYSLKRRVPPVLHVCKEVRNWFIQSTSLKDVSTSRYQLVSLRGENDGV